MMSRFFRNVLKLLPSTVAVVILLLSFWLMSPPDLEALSWNAPVMLSPIGYPELGIAKSVNNSHPASGDEITYTLAYSNAVLNAVAVDAQVYDFLPAGVQFITASLEPITVANNVLLFNVGDVGPGNRDAYLQIRVRVLEGYVQLYNHALIAADGVTPAYASLLTQVTVGEVASRTLILTKTAEPLNVINHRIVYRIQCQNTDPNPINKLTLMDVMPTGMIYNDSSFAPSRVEAPVVEWYVGDLAPGQIWEGIITATTPGYGGFITNTVVADAQQPLATRRVLRSTQIFTEMAILKLNQWTPDSVVHLGREIVYTINYTNDGNLAAMGAVVTDVLPANVTILATDPPSSSFVLGPGNQATATWQLGDFAPDTNGTIVITGLIQGNINRWLHNKVSIAAPGKCITAFSNLDVWVDNQLFYLYMPIIVKKG